MNHEPQNQAQAPNALAPVRAENRLAPSGDKPVSVGGLFDIRLGQSATDLPLNGQVVQVARRLPV